MPIFALILLALTRAEILERMRAPVVTQADGLVQVYADCAEDLRREYQAPVARFAAETVRSLYAGLRQAPVRFARPGIIVHLGDVRTNETRIVSSVRTNDAGIVTRLYLKAPGATDLSAFRLELVKAFFRAVKGVEVGEEAAWAAYRAADPEARVAAERQRLEDWLAGRCAMDDEEALKLMRKVIQPGVASRRDVLTFASRLCFLPRYHCWPFAGRYGSVPFRDAIPLAAVDPPLRLMACRKADELAVFGGGRGEALSRAAAAYGVFLRAFAAGGTDAGGLERLLESADERLRSAWEEAR